MIKVMIKVGHHDGKAVTVVFGRWESFLVWWLCPTFWSLTIKSRSLFTSIYHFMNCCQGRELECLLCAVLWELIRTMLSDTPLAPPDVIISGDAVTRTGAPLYPHPSPTRDLSHAKILPFSPFDIVFACGNWFLPEGALSPRLGKVKWSAVTVLCVEKGRQRSDIRVCLERREKVTSFHIHQTPNLSTRERLGVHAKIPSHNRPSLSKKRNSG